MYTVEIITKVDSVFKKEWESLSRKGQNASYFNSYAWFRTCVDVFSINQFEILTVRSAGNLVAILPMVNTQKHGIKILSNPGGKFNDRNPFLCASYDKKLLMTIIKVLQKKGSFMLPEVTEEVAQILKTRKGLQVVESSVNYILPFSDGPFVTLNKDQKRKIKKALRMHGQNIRFEMTIGDRRSFDIAKQIDKKSYREKKGIGTFVNEDESAFFEKLLKNNPDNMGINILYYKEQPISYEIGIHYNKIYYGVNKSFDANFLHLTPGKLTAYFLLEGLHNKGYKMFDFSRGDDQLKRSFTKMVKKQYDIYWIENRFQKAWLGILNSAKKKIIDTKFLYFAYRKTRSVAISML